MIGETVQAEAENHDDETIVHTRKTATGAEVRLVRLRSRDHGVYRVRVEYIRQGGALSKRYVVLAPRDLRAMRRELDEIDRLTGPGPVASER